MENFIKNVVKNTLLMFVVGAALAAISPALGTFFGEALGEAGTTAAAQHGKTILWTGIFFGGFGGLHAAVGPAADWLFSKGATKDAPAVAPSQAKEKSCGVAINNVQVQPNVSLEANTKVFAQAIEAERQQPQIRQV